MRTNIKSFKPDVLTAKSKAAICDLTAKGFGRPNDSLMQADTLRHLEDAETVQVAYHFGQLVGFALYGRSLWRPCC